MWLAFFRLCVHFPLLLPGPLPGSASSMHTPPPALPVASSASCSPSCLPLRSCRSQPASCSESCCSSLPYRGSSTVHVDINEVAGLTGSGQKAAPVQGTAALYTFKNSSLVSHVSLRVACAKEQVISSLYREETRAFPAALRTSQQGQHLAGRVPRVSPESCGR